MSTPIDRPAGPCEWLGLVVIAAGLFLAVTSTTMVGVALPSIQAELHTTATEQSWIVDAYVIVYSSLLVAGGALGDRHGRKGLFLIGAALFGIGAFIAAIAPGVPVLLIGRVIQGTGPALLVPGSLTIIRTLFTDSRQRDVAIGLWSTASGVALAVGPALGGLLVASGNWRWVFGFNVPLTVVLIAVAARYVPRLARPVADGRFDRFGAVLSTGVIAVLAFGTIEGPALGWSSVLVVGAFVLGGLLLIGLVRWERVPSAPLIRMGLFTRPAFVAANLAAATVFFAFVGGIVYLSVYFQRVQQDGVIAAGLEVSVIGVVFAVAASQSGRLVARFGPEIPMIAGLVVAGVATLLLLRLGTDTPYRLIWWNFALLGAGVGTSLTPMTSVSMASAGAGHAGMVSAVHNALRQVGQVFGVAVLGVLVHAHLDARADDSARFDAHSAASFVTGLHNALVVGGTALLSAAGIAAALFAMARRRTNSAGSPVSRHGSVTGQRLPTINLWHARRFPSRLSGMCATRAHHGPGRDDRRPAAPPALDHPGTAQWINADRRPVSVPAPLIRGHRTQSRQGVRPCPYPAQCSRTTNR